MCVCMVAQRQVLEVDNTTDGGVLHHGSISKERLGKEPALGPAGLRPQCPLGRVLQQSSLLLAAAQQAELCCSVNGRTGRA